MSELVVALQSLKSKFNHPDLIFKTPAGRELTPTINIGGVFEGTSGDKINTVPSLAKFSIDRRVTPSEIIENIEPELRTAIQVACQSIPDLKAELRPILLISPCFISSDSLPTQSFRKTVSQLRQKPAQFDVTSGFTDLHYFVEGGKIPGIGYGPWGQNTHGIDERVSISDLILTTKIYANFMANGQI
jgi:succinyl-diaminopimelate desuccinylase